MENTRVIYIKLFVILIVVSIGIYFIWNGISRLQEGPTPEASILFMDAMPYVGTIKINFTPTEAFVVGDEITADVDVYVLSQSRSAHEENQTSVSVMFIDCFSRDYWSFWKDQLFFNELFLLEYNTTETTSLVYTGKILISYTREGIFGINVTVNSPYSRDLKEKTGSIYGTIYWSFPDAVSIKSYSYREAGKNTHAMNAYIILGLGFAIIGVSLAVLTKIVLSLQAFKSKKKR